MFVILILATAAVLISGVSYVYTVTNDVFHPLSFLCPMMAFLYVWMPARMYASGGVLDYYTDSQLLLIQTICLLGCSALVYGCANAFKTGRPLPRVLPFHNQLSSRRLRSAALLLGVTAWIVWFITRNTIHFGADGGFNGSGYFIETYHLLVPCIAAFMLSGNLTERPFSFWVVVLFLATPLLERGLIDGKRGPTFMIVSALAMAWYLRRGARPAKLALCLGGLGLGVLMMFLFVNRGGDIWNLDNQIVSEDRRSITDPFEDASESNEYVYGAAVILNSVQKGNYYWGRRYLAQVVVRPVPRYIWPDKYADFGVPELDTNAGTRPDEFGEVLGVNGAPGAAPGIIGDLWLEFSWLSIPALGAIGWFYGYSWRRAMSEGGLWMIQYITLVAISVFLVTQTMEAVIFRFLIMSVPFWLATPYIRSRFNLLTGAPVNV